MSKLRVESFSLSLDGFGAGAEQSLQNPLGIGGEQLHSWMLGTRTFQTLCGKAGTGTTGVDDGFTARGFRNVGAWVMGRNMFSPSRGPWPDDSWKGWWGDNPPYHCPTFILTHHARPSIEMHGGTVFHFVTDSLDVAITRAREAAAGKDVRLGGGVSTIRQALRARLVDEMHLAFSPVLLGAGERLFDGIDLVALGYEQTEKAVTEAATHVVVKKR